MYDSDIIKCCLSKMPHQRALSAALSTKLQTIAVTTYLRCRKALNDSAKPLEIATYLRCRKALNDSAEPLEIATIPSGSAESFFDVSRKKYEYKQQKVGVMKGVDKVAKVS